MDLDELRQGIDRCDEKIVRLINERASYGQQIGQHKQKNNLSIYAPDRERAVYEKVDRLNEGPLPNRSIESIYREIMSSTIALERPTRIAYLGPPGTFTHTAALRKFGSAMEYISCREIRDVFLAISRDHADYGVVPIENSTEGSVTQTCDMFMESDLNICSEIFVEIHQNLLARCSLGEIKKIISHPQALAQCRNWLAANAVNIEIMETSSTTKAAMMAAEEEGTAAIASDAAAAFYNLHLLEETIEDCPNNLTRFVVLAHGYGKSTGHDRTSIMFSLQHKSGSLAETLITFRGTGVNLTRIESRPCRTRAWEYTFFLDMEGHADESPVSETLQALKIVTHNLVVLGSYPRAERMRPVKPQSELVQ